MSLKVLQGSTLGQYNILNLASSGVKRKVILKLRGVWAPVWSTEYNVVDVELSIYVMEFHSRATSVANFLVRRAPMG